MLKTALKTAAFVVVISVAACTANAQDIRPVPDPKFSPELASRHMVRGSELIEVVQRTQEACREGMILGMNPFFALTREWRLEYSILRDGSASSGRVFGQRKTSPDSKTLPKPIVLLGLGIYTAGGTGIDSFDSGDEGEATALPSDDELDLICGNDWIVTWLEDEHGNPIAGTTELYCGGTTIPLD